MLDDRQRAGRYLAQTGRTELTPRQRRRIRHKENRQSAAAQVRRDQAAEVRAVQVAKRAEQKRFRIGVKAAAA